MKTVETRLTVILALPLSVVLLGCTSARLHVFGSYDDENYVRPAEFADDQQSLIVIAYPSRRSSLIYEPFPAWQKYAHVFVEAHSKAQTWSGNITIWHGGIATGYTIFDVQKPSNRIVSVFGRSEQGMVRLDVSVSGKSELSKTAQKIERFRSQSQQRCTKIPITIELVNGIQGAGTIY